MYLGRKKRKNKHMTMDECGKVNGINNMEKTEVGKREKILIFERMSKCNRKKKEKIQC